jgi:hypothetical protein
MKVAIYFITSFILGITLGNFLLSDTPLFFSPFIAVQGSGTPQDVAMTVGARWSEIMSVELVVSLVSAMLLFAGSYVLWRKYRAEHYFAHQQTHWQTF